MALRVDAQYTFLMIAVLLSNTLLFSQSRPSPLKYWIFFRDKGPEAAEHALLRRVGESLTLRALERRMKHLGPAVASREDLPLFQPYIAEIEKLGGRFCRRSHWLNAASFVLTEAQRESVELLPFVNHLQPVHTLYRRDAQPLFSTMMLDMRDTLDYGLSFSQASMIGATKVHEMNVSGQGVLVGMLDTGFRWRIHEALQNARVIAEHDFIQNDDTTANQSGDSGLQDEHGTLTMSILGGYMPGKLIGPAYGVQFVLGKTEYVPSETQIEEDNWVAGIEWMESLGVDVVSSSLGYSIFDDGTGYRWDNGDFNGRTAVTSLAAVRAARLGVIVCTAMGNEGNGNGARGTLIAPSDADSIFSVGAATFVRTIASFTSTGPTNDGRIKPEVVAPGQGVYGAFPGQATYFFNSGTSTATPLVAASAALVLSARSELTAMQVRDALRFTADTIATGDPRVTVFPNNFAGWGIVNVYNALSFPTIEVAGTANRVAAFIGAANGVFMDSVRLYYSVDTSSIRTIVMVRVAGPANRSNGTYRADVFGIPNGTIVRFSIAAVDSSGAVIRVPADTTKTYSFAFGSTILNPPDVKIATSLALLQNYPNPFNGTTTIRFDTPTALDGTLIIYNLLGQTVKILYNGTFRSGNNFFSWDGTNERSVSVASGVYFYVVRTGPLSQAKKIILLR